MSFGPAMDPRDVIRKKRDGGVLEPAEIEAFLAGYVAGQIPDYQASALLMGIFVRGMQPEELAVWTRAMLESGTQLDFSALGLPMVDKHSTGGVGDKASIPLAPAVAACGVGVPMISGRGLGHTGGTLDKLEAIPGFRTDLSEAEFGRVLDEVGCAMGGQTADLVPADRLLYALRDATGLVESIPLVASSIMSKKLAEGLDGLVLDVKFGSGAFFPEVERGLELARTMLGIAESFGVRASVLHTAMDRPLGHAIGHTLEIEECIACLEGGGPAELRELVCALGAEMLVHARVAPDVEAGCARIAGALDDGSARQVMDRLVAAQGADPRSLAGGLPAGADTDLLNAERSGHVVFRDVRALGIAAATLGGGRRQLGDQIDPAVGLVTRVTAGEHVEAGAPLVEIHHSAGRGLVEARALLERCIELVDEAPALQPLIRARL